MKKAGFYFFALFNLTVIIFFWLKGSGQAMASGPYGQMLAFGRLSGLLLAFLILLQFITAGRTGWLEETFGLDRLLIFHRYTGFSLVIFLLLHPLLLAAAYAGNISGIFTQLKEFVLHFEDLMPAALSVLLLLAVAASSVIISVRKMNYEWWRLIHLAVYLAILLSWGHQLSLGGDFSSSKLFTAYWYALYSFTALNILYFRFFKPLWNFKIHKFRVEKIVAENPFVVSVYITGEKMESFKFLPGQFMIFRFLDKKRWWQAHPFSLSTTANGKSIRISIKNSGDYTSAAASIKPGTKVLIEGPYGTFTSSRSKSDKILMIAGGIGITPIMTLMPELKKAGKNIILLYGNKSMAETTFKPEIDNLAADGMLQTNYIMSSDNSWTGNRGRIDAAAIKKFAPDFLERDVYLCGPPLMTNSVRAVLRTLGVSRDKIFYEKFSL